MSDPRHSFIAVSVRYLALPNKKSVERKLGGSAGFIGTDTPGQIRSHPRQTPERCGSMSYFNSGYSVCLISLHPDAIALHVKCARIALAQYLHTA